MRNPKSIERATKKQKALTLKRAKVKKETHIGSEPVCFRHPIQKSESDYRRKPFMQSEPPIESIPSNASEPMLLKNPKRKERAMVLKRPKTLKRAINN